MLLTHAHVFILQIMNLKFAVDVLAQLDSQNDARPTLSHHAFSHVAKDFISKTLGSCDALDSLKTADVDFKILLHLLSSSQPDLKIICEDKTSVFSYKMLFGIINECFGDIFLDKDVLLESVSTIMMPLHSEKIQEYLTSLVDGSVDFKIFDNLLNQVKYRVTEDGKKVNSAEFDSLAEIDIDESDRQTDDCDTNVDCKEEHEEDIREDTKPHIINVKIRAESSRKEQCPHCKKMFKDLDGHIIKCGVFKQRNLNRNLKKVQCPTCGIEFIQRHYEDKHQYECRKRKVPCANCGEEILYKLYEEVHQYVCNNIPIPESNYFIWKLKPHPCEICGKVLPGKGSYNAHLMIHREDSKIYMCEHCDFKSYNLSNLKQHAKRHVAREICHCDICGKACIDIKRHIQRQHTNTEVKMVKCEICGKELKNNKTLLKHKRKVHEERRFPCSQCNYRASDSFNLKLHVNKVHLGVKDLKKQCQYCDVRTTNVERHIKIFHPEK